jgi:putative ABC transport system substrate-binding protein
MHTLGWEEGRNFDIDFVQLDSADAGRSIAVAAALIRRGVDAIYAAGPEDVLKAAVAATSTVPIVIIAMDYDPVARHYAASLARPGGNVTGVVLQENELVPKRLELLAQTVPELARVVALWDQFSADHLTAARDAARSLNIRLDGIECANPPYDYQHVLAGVEGGRGDVLLLLGSPLFFRDRENLALVMLGHRLAAMFPLRQWVDSGGLISYGPNLIDMNRLAADFFDRIARGAKAADLPVQQPTRFELVINLKTAKELGLTIPQTILLRADEVIE